MSIKCSYLKKIVTILLIAFPAFATVYGQSNKTTYKLVKTIRGKISPKSIVNCGNNLFFVQNMMYHHSITVYDSLFNLVATISDSVKPANFGYKDITCELHGSPVESAATKDGKYIWVSNYCMYGAGYTNPGCDTCCKTKHDASFVYKINTKTYKIENIIKVGSVPKYLSITPDQKKLVVSNWCSGDVSIIDLSTEKEIKRLSIGRAPRGIAFDTASKYAYIAIMGSDKIIQLDLENYHTQTLASGLQNPRHLCVQHNYLYASLNGEGNICRINLSSHKVTKLAVGKAPRSMVLSASKNKLFVNCYEDSKVSVIDLNSFKLESEIKTSAYPIGICLNNENKQVWVSCYPGYVQVFDEVGSTTDKLVGSTTGNYKQSLGGAGNPRPNGSSGQAK